MYILNAVSPYLVLYHNTVLEKADKCEFYIKIRAILCKLQATFHKKRRGQAFSPPPAEDMRFR